MYILRGAHSGAEVLKDSSCHSMLVLTMPCFHAGAGANPGLRVILMSATADAELFASYFQQRLGQPCGMVSIPGFTHPVTGEQRSTAQHSTGQLGRAWHS